MQEKGIILYRIFRVKGASRCKVDIVTGSLPTEIGDREDSYFSNLKVSGANSDSIKKLQATK